MDSLSIPPELLLHIFESGYYSPSGAPDYAFLICVVLVCKLWSNMGHALLWRSVLFKKGEQVALLAKSGALSPCTTAGIRSLDLVLDCDTPLAGLLASCTRLYELRLTNKMHELPAAQQHALGDLPSIRAFTVVESPVMSRVPMLLLQRLPNLRHLRLQSELTTLPPAAEPRFALHELAYRRTPREATLAWILRRSTESLEVLDLWETPSPALRDFLAVRGPQLRSLRLAHLSPLWFKPLRHCTALEELKLWQLPSLALLHLLPRTLEHFAFSNFTRNPLRFVIQAIPQLPRLRSITYDHYSESLTDFANLELACATAGVEMCRNPFPFWNCEDPIPVHKLPRRKSLSNVRFMTQV